MNIKDLFLSKSDKEIARIKELVETIANAEAELKELTGEETAPPGPKRGRPAKQNGLSELPMK